MALFKNTNKYFSSFYLNFSSRLIHFVELSELITEYKLNINFLGISESRLKLNKNPLISIQLPGCNIKYTPNESAIASNEELYIAISKKNEDPQRRIIASYQNEEKIANFKKTSRYLKCITFPNFRSSYHFCEMLRPQKISKPQNWTIKYSQN